MGKIITGSEISKNIKSELKNSAKLYMIKPCLAVFILGEEPIIEEHIKNMDNLCNEIGIYLKQVRFGVNVLEKELTNRIIELNNDEYINGIIVQLPLPDYLNTQRVLNHVTSNKDTEGLNDINSGRLYNGNLNTCPSISLAVMELLKSNNIELAFKNVVIVGANRLAGRPLSMLMIKENACVTLCSYDTPNLKDITSKADILVSASGNANSITSDYIKEDSIVVDAGISYVDGKICGDVSEDVKNKAKYFIPFVGGVYDVALLMVLKNVIKCYEKTRK